MINRVVGRLGCNISSRFTNDFYVAYDRILQLLFAIELINRFVFAITPYSALLHQACDRCSQAPGVPSCSYGAGLDENLIAKFFWQKTKCHHIYGHAEKGFNLYLNAGHIQQRGVW